MLAHKDYGNITDYFPVQSCSWTMGQHSTGCFLVQCQHRQIKTTLYRLFSCEKMFVRYGQHCTTLSQTYLDNIDQTIFLCNVVPAWSIQLCIGYFSHKFFCLPWGNIAQVIVQCNVDPERSGHHCRIISIAKLFMDCAVIGGCNDRSAGGRQNFVF